MNNDTNNEHQFENIPTNVELWKKYKELDKKIDKTIKHLDHLSNNIESIEEVIDSNVEFDNLDPENFQKLLDDPAIIRISLDQKNIDQIPKIFESFNSMMSKIYITPILDDEYLICETSDSATSNSHTNLNGVLFECIPNKNIKNRQYGIIDALEYLKNSHYINFLIAYLRGTSAYSKDDFNMHACINANPDIQNIIISANTNITIPKFINTESFLNYENTSNSTIKYLTNDFAIMERVESHKSFLNPHIKYNIRLSQMLSSVHIPFGDIKLLNLYDSIIQPLIDDAFEKFYKYRDPTLSYNQWNFNIYFKIDYTEYEMGIEMDVVPASYIIGNEVVQVKFTGDGWLNINTKCSDYRILSKELCSNYSYLLGTRKTQVLGIVCADHGEIDTVEFEGNRFCMLSYLFTNKRTLDVRELDAYQPITDYSSFEVYPSKQYPSSRIIEYMKIYSNNDLIYDHWLIINPIRLPVSTMSIKNPEIVLHGFITLNYEEIVKDFGEVVDDFILPETIRDELMDVFGLDNLSSDREIEIQEYYRTSEFMRFSITTIFSGERKNNNNVLSKEPSSKRKSFLKKFFKKSW